MARKLLFALLVISLVIEFGLALGLFFAPDITAKQFKVILTPDTGFLAYIIAWLCVFVSMIIVLAISELKKGNSNYAALCYVMGFFWIGIGIGIYVSYGRPDNLFLDSVKGVLLVGLTYWERMGKQG